jgi:hypothetical protein
MVQKRWLLIQSSAEDVGGVESARLKPRARSTANPSYFRARGEHWSLGIGGEPCCAPEWEHAEWFGQWPDAGWMTAEEAVMFLCKAAERYAEGKPGAKLEDDPTRANRS